MLPSLLLMRVSLPRETWRRRLAAGAIATGAGAVVIAALAFAFSASLASFLREHKPLRYLLTPTAFVYNAVANVVHRSEAPRRVTYIEGPVETLTGARGARPLLVFLVVGPMVDVKLIALQAGTFGPRFAAVFAPLTFVVAVASAALVGWWLL